MNVIAIGFMGLVAVHLVGAYEKAEGGLGFVTMIEGERMRFKRRSCMYTFGFTDADLDIAEQQVLS